MNKGKPRSYVHLSLQKALTVLSLFENSESMTTKEIADCLNVKAGTIYPMLSTFARFGYVERDVNTKRYSLGLSLMRLGTLVLRRLRIRDRAQKYMKELAKQCQENVHLGVLNDGMVMYIERIEVSPSPMISAYVGKRVPAYCTALGKAILAFLPEDELERYLESVKMEKFTEWTISDVETLKSHLRSIRRKGIAVDSQEHQIGGMCFAVPIRSHQNEIIAALSVSIPKSRYTQRIGENIKARLKDAGAAISGSLGYVDEKKTAHYEVHVPMEIEI